MQKTKRRLIHLAVVLIIVGLGALGFVALTSSKPELKRRLPPVPLPVVQVVKIKTGARVVTVRGEGTVTPLHEIQLVPQVSGQVIFVSPELVNGGAFKKGQILLRIDPLDYQLAVTLAQAKVKDSESRLKIAQQEAASAREEWDLLYKDRQQDSRKPPPLVVKEPQLEAARARLAADRSDLRRARLNLERTRFKAPFNGRVSAENVDVGQYVSAGQPLATLFSTDAIEIVVPMDNEDLFWFHVPGFTPGRGPGSRALVKARIAGRESAWTGRVMRAEGKIDARTRMIDVVVRVQKPYSQRPPLVAGLFVTVEIQGRTLNDAVAIPRVALREDDTVWVVDDRGKLAFRKVEVVRLSPDEAILANGLKNGERVVTSPLKAVTDGMQVRVAGAGGKGTP